MRPTQDLMGYGQERDDDEPKTERLKHCEHAVGANNMKGYDECAEPASFRISWDDSKTWLYLCEKHFQECQR